MSELAAAERFELGADPLDFTHHLV